MDKKLLGDWGSTLDDRGYAEAVAGLGVHAARPMGIGNRIRWRSRLLEAAGSPDWRDVAGLDPVTATNLWRRRVLNLSVSSRILDWPSLEDPDGLLSTLAYADPRSLIVEPSVVDDGAQRSWRWPLRVGVLPGADLAGLEDFFAVSTAPGLFRVEALDGARETCDLLLLPRTFRDSLFGSYDAFEGLRARATVVITNLDYDNVLGGQARMEAEILRRRYSASAIVGLPTRLTQDVVGAVFRELAHNRHLDEAVFDALRGLHIDGAPCIVGTPDFMEDACLVSVAHRYDQIYHKGIMPPDKPIRIFRGRSTRAPTLAPGTIADRLAKDSGFEHETDGALTLANEHAKVEDMVDSARVPRWMHAQFLDYPTLAAHAGADVAPPVGETNLPVDADGTLFIVRVSPSLEGPRASVPLPEKELDFSAGAVLLHVMVELTGASIAPLPWTPRTWREVLDPQFIGQLPRGGAKAPADSEEVAIAQCPIELPEAGDSSLAVFYLVPHEGKREIVGRISLVHRNRVLQTVRFTAQRAGLALDAGRTSPGDGITGASLVGAKADAAIDLAPEPQIRDRLDDLADAREFDATLLVADDLGPAPHMTMRRGKDIEQLALSTAAMREPIEKIVAALNLLTKRPSDQDVLPLNANRVKSTLYTLASFGRQLYQALPAWLQPESIQRIQVVTRGDTYFPAEFVYDGPAPSVEASVCENTAGALLAGTCGDCPNQQSKLHICPMRFFGLSRTIERHSSPTNAQAASTRRRPRPSPTRAPFGDPAPVLRGASAKAYDFASSADLVEKMKLALGALDKSAIEANSWKEWSNAAAKKPKLFVALPHSEEFHGVPVLELGTGNLISKPEIATAGLIADGEEPRLVMLLGCSLADATAAFATYPSEFRSAGADIVVAAIAPILGADSVPIASEFARILHEVGQAERKTLGELLALVRRRCLAAGHPGVLGVVAYGDADWVFGGAPHGDR